VVRVAVVPRPLQPALGVPLRAKRLIPLRFLELLLPLSVRGQLRPSRQGDQSG
jgi:hypothetical protein